MSVWFSDYAQIILHHLEPFLFPREFLADRIAYLLQPPPVRQNVLQRMRQLPISPHMLRSIILNEELHANLPELSD